MITLQKNVRDILNRIDKIFAAGGRAHNYEGPAATSARQLWDVLSALRGPDADVDLGLKDATTAVIRAASFPKTHKESNCIIPATMNYDDQDSATLRGAQHGNHFNNHAERAFMTLGLDWHEVNSDDKIDSATKPLRRRKKSKSRSARS